MTEEIYWGLGGTHIGGVAYRFGYVLIGKDLPDKAASGCEICCWRFCQNDGEGDC